MKAQEKIRNANILLITMRSLANEVAKNLVLAGIGSLTIVDHAIVTEADLGAQFFLSAEEGHIGMNRAEAAAPAIRRLNPRVVVNVDTEGIRTKGPSFFAPYDIIIATDLDSSTLNVVSTASRLNNRPFYAAGCEGIYGFIFADLIEHDYVIERAISNVTTQLKPETRTRSVIAVNPKKDNDKIELVTKRELYSTWLLASCASTLPTDITKSSRRRKLVTPALSCLRALWEFAQTYSRTPNLSSRDDLARFTILVNQKHQALGLPSETLKSEFLRSFMQNIGSEIAPVAAVLGGQLAQDVINVLGQNQQPIQNMVIFDGDAMEAVMYPLHPEGNLGRKLLDHAPQANGVVAADGPIVSAPVVDPSQVISLDD